MSVKTKDVYEETDFLCNMYAFEANDSYEEELRPLIDGGKIKVVWSLV